MARLVSEKSFDAVLMDCEMPILDGYEATSRIRRAEQVQGSGRELPMVALTASALLADRERALAAGMNEYLTKPFTFLDLHRVLSAEARPPSRWRPHSPRTRPSTSPLRTGEGQQRGKIVIVGRLQPVNVAPSRLSRLLNAGTSPSQALSTQLHDEKVRHQS